MRQAVSPQLEFAPGIQVEHVCLESEEVYDARCQGTAVGPSLAIGNWFRGCLTELTVVDGHRLAVRAQRPQRTERQYVLDLRFIDGEPVKRRYIAWRLGLAGLVLAALAVAISPLADVPHVPRWLDLGWLGAIGALLVAIGLGVLALHRTYATFEFQSTHGRATLVEVTGNLGCSKAAAPFIAEVVRQISDARAGGRPSRRRFLCDELHEHRRLFEEGVLSKDAYEAAKRRILQAHD